MTKAEIELGLAKAETPRQKLEILNENAFNLLMSDFVLMEQYSREAVILANNLKDKESMALGMLNLGKSLGVQGKYKEALQHYKESLELYTQLHNPAGQVRCLTNIGIIYYSNVQYGMALNYYLKSIALSEPNGLNRSLCIALNYVGELYIDIEKYAQAESNIHRAWKLSENLDDKLARIRPLLAFSRLYKRQGKVKEAFEFINHAYLFASHVKHDYLLISILSQLGELEEMKGNLNEALDYYQQSRRIAINNNSQDAILEQLLKIANILIILNPSQALQYAIDALQLANQLNIPEQQSNAHKLVALIYENEGDIQKALQYQKEFIRVRLEIVSTYKKQAVELVEISVEMESKQREKEIIQKEHNALTESIVYAKRIQTAMLPFPERIARTLPHHFILFMPRDHVSGDFYWFVDLPSGETLVAAADCTGHGVPGAFMSMICFQLLSDIVQVRGIQQPDLILNELHKGVRVALKQESGDSRDGMDITLISISKNRRKICMAGANNPLVYVQNNQLHELKADKQSIGGYADGERFFNAQYIDVEPNTMLYMFSDGFQDQFGGLKGRKFMVKNFRRLLHEISHLDMETQKEKLQDTIVQWMNIRTKKQMDDILVLGIKL